MLKRVFLVVLDGVGAGELPDAADYGDAGSSTLVNTAAAVGGLQMPALNALGFGHIQRILGLDPVERPKGCWGRMREKSPGKDSVTGHWEMAGVVLERPFPTYPNGFPEDVIAAFEAAIGTHIIGNYAASGTEIIQSLGAEHLQTGCPIVYTSADSVFQIAAHEGLFGLERLYDVCRIARELLAGEHAVGRVIARPFVGGLGAFSRTQNRRDYPLTPPPTVLDALAEAGMKVHAIGKIEEFFNGRGISTWDDTRNNSEHTAALIRAARENDSHLVFANLEDTDMLFGHRNDPRGLADCLANFDAAMPDLLAALRPGDLFVLTNDHGNDPTTPSTDHSREYAFLLAYGPGLKAGIDLGDRGSFSDLSATLRDAFGLPPGPHGDSFLGLMLA